MRKYILVIGILLFVCGIVIGFYGNYLMVPDGLSIVFYIGLTSWVMGICLIPIGFYGREKKSTT